MLKIKKVSKSFGGVKAVNDCSFEIEEGKITALIGPNGAGKTTLFDIISGLIRADLGSILFKDKDLARMSPHKIADLGISRTFQQVRLFKNLTLLDHLEMAQSTDDSNLLKQMVASSKVPAQKEKEYAGILKDFGIKKGLHDLAADLSYGQRKLLQMAMAFAKPHELLMLDEPVAGVNNVIQNHIESLLLEFKKRGETIMIIDHDMAFVRKLADHVVVLESGKLLTQGLPDKVLAEREVIEAYLGQ